MVLEGTAMSRLQAEVDRGGRLKGWTNIIHMVHTSGHLLHDMIFICTCITQHSLPHASAVAGLHVGKRGQGIGGCVEAAQAGYLHAAHRGGSECGCLG